MFGRYGILYIAALLVLACGSGVGQDESRADGPYPIVPPGSGTLDHVAHFARESVKPQVVASVAWRSQAEIDRDASKINRDDPVFPVYDPEMDAAKVTIKVGHPLTQLRNRFEWVGGTTPLSPDPERPDLELSPTGEIWAQYEIMYDSVLLGPRYNQRGMGLKSWRWQDDQKVGCNDERRLTAQCGLGTEPNGLYPHLTHRDGCGIVDPDGRREVRTMENGDYNEQPGGDCRAIYGRTEPHPTTFRYAPNTWIRITYCFDFREKRLRIWARRYDDDITRKVVDFEVQGWEEHWGMDVAGLWLHSTSRLHDHWPTDLPTGHVYARNQIISKAPIAF